MKHLYLFFTLYLISISTYAQTDCSTPDASEEEFSNLPWYRNNNWLASYYDSVSQVHEMPNPATRYGNEDVERPWLRIPIKFWVWLDDNGNPGDGTFRLPNDSEYKRALDHLNETFRENEVKIQFYYCLQTANSTSAINISNFVQRGQVGNIRTEGMVNIHVVNEGGNQ